MPESSDSVSVSVCMIVKNEEAVLRRCLESLQGTYDQLVIADTGSTDDTINIARSFTDEVYSIPWEDDFGKARNISFSYAKCDYIMYVDADDILPSEEKEKFLQLKKDLSQMPVDERPKTIIMAYDAPEGGGLSYRHRMVARHDGPYWGGAIHERAFVLEPEMTTEIKFLHRKLVKPPKDRNCNIIRKIPRDELKEDFWLCIQCYLDMTLAEHHEEAKEYYLMAKAAKEHNASYCVWIARILIINEYFENALLWLEMALESEDNTPDQKLWIYQQLVKAYIGLGRMQEAIDYNDKVLEINPANLAARTNRLILEKKLKEE